MHSATKYFGGHSDLLAGILVAKDQKVWNELWTNVRVLLRGFDKIVTLRPLENLYW
jgi:cystathionine beta-lyase/cystathionine gamma-synthase